MEEEKIEIQSQTQGMTDEEYLKVIQEMRDNSVAKADYDKLSDQYKNLVRDYANGVVRNDIEEKQIEDPQELLKMMDNPDITNLEYAILSLRQRDAVLATGGEDPYLPTGRRISPTSQDYADAELAAAGLREMIERADGDAVAFRNEYNRMVKSSVLPKKR